MEDFLVLIPIYMASITLTIGLGQTLLKIDYSQSEVFVFNIIMSVIFTILCLLFNLFTIGLTLRAIFLKKAENLQSTKNAMIFCTFLGKECMPDISKANIGQDFNPAKNSYFRTVNNTEEIIQISKYLLVKTAIKNRKYFNFTLLDAIGACFVDEKFFIKPATAHEIMHALRKRNQVHFLTFMHS